MSFGGEELFPGGQPVIVPWCKRCEAGTPSERCERCGRDGAACAACAVCGRCPGCDGPLP